MLNCRFAGRGGRQGSNALRRREPEGLFGRLALREIAVLNLPTW